MVEFISIGASSYVKAALHPKPKGIIQFIGAFVFGSCPEYSYKHLLESLYKQRYSLILYSFPFKPLNFEHWHTAIELLENMYDARSSIINEIYRKPYQEQTDKDNLLILYSDDSNYYWLGHSLGCKYILLLEILSNKISDKGGDILADCLRNREFESLKEDIFKIEKTRIETTKLISRVVDKPCQIRPFIRDQPCLLLAPEINNSVQIFSQSFHPPSGLGFPSRNETKCLIENSQNIFTLTAILSFNLDNIAKDDVAYLVNQLNSRGLQPFLHKIFWGWHFEPQAIHVEHLVCCINSILQELRQRHLNGVSQQIQCRYELNQG